VEAQVEALLATINKYTPVNFQPCDISKETQSLKLGKACGFDGIPKECIQHLPRRVLVHLTPLFNHHLCLGHFLASWKKAKIISLLKPSKDLKFTPKLTSDQPLSCPVWDNYLRS
jgi:hypothetical protein